MVIQIISIVIVVFLISFFLWKVIEEIRDSGQFGHHSEHRFSMNLSTRQAMGIFEHTSGLVAIDVRPKKRFEMGHLPGAVNAPFEKGNLDESEIENIEREKPVLLYCDGGYRSRKALAAIEDSGFQSIYHINRGLLMWRAFGGPIEEGKPKES